MTISTAESATFTAATIMVRRLSNSLAFRWVGADARSGWRIWFVGAEGEGPARFCMRARREFGAKLRNLTSLELGRLFPGDAGSTG